MNIQRGDVLKARNQASGTPYWMSGYANWYAKRNRRTGFGCVMKRSAKQSATLDGRNAQPTWSNFST